MIRLRISCWSALAALVLFALLPVARAQDGFSEATREALRSQLDLLVEASCVPA